MDGPWCWKHLGPKRADGVFEQTCVWVVVDPRVETDGGRSVVEVGADQKFFTVAGDEEAGTAVWNRTFETAKAQATTSSPQEWLVAGARGRVCSRKTRDAQGASSGPRSSAFGSPAQATRTLGTRLLWRLSRLLPRGTGNRKS